ncbi:MAG: hypothetical protein DSY55_05790 [Clostridia bacterium]|nr:MAG: hypothetical protein DSY55_05790 [Clostridia bacterium]
MPIVSTMGINASLTLRMRLESDIQRPGNGGVSGSVYWPMAFDDQLPGPFRIGADSDFAANAASLNPALMRTLPVQCF